MTNKKVKVAEVVTDLAFSSAGSLKVVHLQSGNSFQTETGLVKIVAASNRKSTAKRSRYTIDDNGGNYQGL